MAVHDNGEAEKKILQLTAFAGSFFRPCSSTDRIRSFYLRDGGSNPLRGAYPPFKKISMSKNMLARITCKMCGTRQYMQVYSSINVTLLPELKQKYLEKEINFFRCKSCSDCCFLGFPMVYHDMDKEIYFEYRPESDEVDSEDEGDVKAMQEILNTMGERGEYIRNHIVVNQPEKLYALIVSLERGRIARTPEDVQSILSEAFQIVSKEV